MCLLEITKEFKGIESNDIVKCYKVFINRNDKLESYIFNKAYAEECWLDEREQRDLAYGNDTVVNERMDGPRYGLGFHAFTSLEDAETYADRHLGNIIWNTEIREVHLTDLVVEGKEKFDTTVIVGRRMFVCSKVENNRISNSIFKFLSASVEDCVFENCEFSVEILDECE